MTEESDAEEYPESMAQWVRGLHSHIDRHQQRTSETMAAQLAPIQSSITILQSQMTDIKTQQDTHETTIGVLAKERADRRAVWRATLKTAGIVAGVAAFSKMAWDVIKHK